MSKFIVCLLMLSVCGLVFAGTIENKQAAAKFYADNCSACHGEFAEGMDGFAPKLKGEVAYYLNRSLKDYQKGNRFSEHKEYVSMLDRKDRKFISKYLEGNGETDAAIPVTDKKIAKFYVKKCGNCHGMSGEGTDHGNRLRGQFASYTEEQIGKFINGERPSRIMNGTIIGLQNTNDSKKLIHDLSVYLQAGE